MNPRAFLTGGGQLAELIAAFDWRRAGYPPVDDWPGHMKTATALMLRSQVPMLMLWGARGVMVYNDAYAAFAGARHPGLLGAEVRSGWPEVADFADNVQQVVLGGGTLHYADQELTLHHRGQAEQVWMNLDYSPLLDDQGVPAGVMAIVVETTDKVRAERSVAGERDRLARLFEQSPRFMCLLEGPEHVVRLANQSYFNLVGRHHDLGLPVAAALPEAAEQGFVSLLDQVYRSGKAFAGSGMKYAYRPAPDAAPVERWLEFVYQPFHAASGDVTGIFVEGVDVTDRTAAERRLGALVLLTDVLRDINDPAGAAYAASKVLGETLDASRVGYGTIDADLDLLHVERDWTAPGVESLSGATPLRDYGTFIDSLKRDQFVSIADVRLDPRTRMAAAALEGKSTLAFVNIPVIEQGRLVALMFVNSARPREWSAEDLAFINEAAARTRTTVERLRALQALRDSEIKLRELNETLTAQVAERSAERDRLWNLSQDMLARADYSGMMSAVSSAWTQVLGWTERELLTRGYSTFMHPDDMPPTLEAIGRMAATRRPSRFENRIATHDGGWKHIEWTVAPEPDGENFIAVGRDVSVAKAHEADLLVAQEALRQSQKMEAIGQLTGGIAHDFNNLLAAMNASLQVLRRRLGSGRLDDAERYLDITDRSIRRAASLTQRLLAFSRRQTLDPKPIDVNRLIGGLDELIRRTVGPTVTLEVVGAGGLWLTKVDSSQLENALLNLCINARDAMSPDGGRLTIETANKWLDERSAAEQELPPGQYISICVTDTGTGMSADVIARAFDPFFTTKPIGQGTGLGLSMVYGFVRQSGGQVRIYSELGRGTTMCLYLPRYVGPLEAREAPPAAAAIESAHGECLVVVEDEETIREIVASELQECGYRVMVAGDGATALQLLRSDVQVDLLLTDVGLPGGLNGRQVADAARVARPALKVLFMTGYAENAVVGNGFLDHGMQIITKPFDIDVLTTKVRAMLEA